MRFGRAQNVQDNEATEEAKAKQAWETNSDEKGDEMQTKTEQQDSVVSLIRDFCDYTSAHGPGRIHGTKNIIQKVVWSLLFIGAIAMFTIQIYILFKKFQSRPLSTLIRMEHDSSLPFPTVTFCNFNPIRNRSIEIAPASIKSTFSTYSAINTTYDDKKDDYPKDKNETKIGKWRRKKRQMSGTDSSPTGDYNPTDDYNPTTNDYYDPHYDDPHYDDPYYDDPYYDDPYYDDSYFNDPYYDPMNTEGMADPTTLDKGFVMKEKLMNVLAGYPSSLKPLGHQFQDMVISCTYRGAICSNYTDKVWRSYWHYKYGNCYVFNSGNNLLNKTGKNLKSNKAGPSHGLNLELNIEQSEYIGPLTEEAGIRIDISSIGQMPFPLEQGMSVAPGFATSIGIRQTDIYREDPFDNGRCLRTSDLGNGNLYYESFNASYSPMACKESCLAFNQRKYCGCMEYRFPIPLGSLICDVMNKTHALCLSRVQQDFKENKLNCSKSCRSPCKEQIYRKSMSVAAWPSENNEKHFKDNGEFEEETSYRSNILKVNIFFEELNYEIIEEKPSYELVNFASDFGGQLGLWIGFSVLTIAEFLELMLLIIRAIIRKFTRVGRVRPIAIANLKQSGDPS